MTDVNREQVLAFRLRNHHLTSRLTRDGLIEAVAACGIQNSPPGSGALSLFARISDLTPEDVEDSLLTAKSTVQVWLMRAAPCLVPTDELGLFTQGLLPDDDASLLYYIQGSTGHLDKLGLTVGEAVQLSAEALSEALSGRHLTKEALAKAMASLVAPRLSPKPAAIWNTPDGWRRNSHGETVVRFALSILSLQNRLCLLPGTGRATEIALTEEWLPRPVQMLPPETAAAELLRRYLHGYGPSTPAQFALWGGISRPQADRSWSLITTELQPVRLGRNRAWLLSEDVPDVRDAVLPQGVRLLPSYDPYLQSRDRDLLVADKARRREIWRIIGNPGVVLADGEVAGTWRPRKQGPKLTVQVELDRPLPPHLQAELRSEAEGLALFRGCRSVEVLIDD